jgi:Family of unknown function (DUF6516)
VSAKRDRGDPHDWNWLDSYLLIHDSYMQQYIDDGFVVDHDVKATLLGDPPRLLVLRGRIRCQHGLFLDVLKELSIEHRSGKMYVRTEQYNYHAGIEGERDRAIFRYDNAHPHPGHDDPHHKHWFDYTTWESIEPPEWIGRDNWPHLSDVLEELQGWYERGQFLNLEQDAPPAALSTDPDMVTPTTETA